MLVSVLQPFLLYFSHRKILVQGQPQTDPLPIPPSQLESQACTTTLGLFVEMGSH
jgi:hypothetical protein